MDLIEMIKQKTLRLLGLVLIAVPLIACYTILRILNVSANITMIVTVCLSGIVYFLLVTRIEPLLSRMLPFLSSKTQTEFTSAKLELRSIDIQKAQSPNSFPTVSRFDILRSNNVIRNFRGNWVHS